MLSCAHLCIRYLMLEEIPPAREWANKSLDYATTYLSGRWLEPYRDLSIEMPNISPKQREVRAKNIGLWLDEFRNACALAAAIDRWEDFSTLSLGPHLDYPIPEIQGKDVRLHYVIAQYFLHGMSPSFLDRVQELEEGTRASFKSCRLVNGLAWELHAE